MDVIKPAPGLVLRVLRFPLTLLVIEAFAVVLVVAGLSFALRKAGTGADGPLRLLGALAIAVALVGLWKALRRWLEGEGDGEFTLPRAGTELGGGLALGFLLFSGMALVVLLLGGLRIEGVRGAGQIWAMLAHCTVCRLPWAGIKISTSTPRKAVMLSWLIIAASGRK